MLKSYYGEVLTTSHLNNRLLLKVLENKTQLDILPNFFPYFNSSNKLPTKVFNCVSFFHIYPPNCKKLLSCKMCVYGIFSNQKGLQILLSYFSKKFYNHGHHFCWKSIIFLNIYFQESLGENKFISYDLHGLYKSMPPTPKVSPIGSTSLSPN